MELSVLPIAVFTTQVVFLFKNNLLQGKRFFFLEKELFKQKIYSRKIFIQVLLGKLSSLRPAHQRGLLLHRTNFEQDIKEGEESENPRGNSC